MASYTYKVKDMCLEHVFECGQTFRWNSVSCEKGEYYEGACQGYAAKIFLHDGILRVDATGGTEEFWHNYFDLGRDYGELKSILSGKHSTLDKAMLEGYGIRILNQDYFEMLISFIVSQNNNIPRIKKCIEALCNTYGEVIEGTDLHAFPTAERLSALTVDELMKLKLGYRCSYIIETAKRYLEVGMPVAKDTAALKKELCEYHGVGPKVADCIILFGLSRVDAFPIDVWVKRIMNDLYGFDLNDLKGMQAKAREEFGDIGGIAQQYLFHYYRS